MKAHTDARKSRTEHTYTEKHAFVTRELYLFSGCASVALCNQMNYIETSNDKIFFLGGGNSNERKKMKS